MTPGLLSLTILIAIALCCLWRTFAWVKRRHDQQDKSWGVRDQERRAA